MDAGYVGEKEGGWSKQGEIGVVNTSKMINTISG